MPANLRQPSHRRQESLADVSRMGAGKPNPIEPRNPVKRLEQPREVARRIVRRHVVVHDLAEQLHFAVPRLNGLPDFRHDVGFGPHPLVTARV